MANYNWREHIESPWTQRFPDWVNGYMQWRNFKVQESHLDLRDWLPPLSDKQLNCPRVFISHRQADSKLAERVAWIALQEGFEFWLDVWDPALQALTNYMGQTPGNKQKGLAIASIIEMALLNSSHVLAVMTPQTRGSLWVPYEYGRVKEERMLSTQAASWVHPNLNNQDLPEYLHFGQVIQSEIALERWFKKQMRQWNVAYGTCPDDSKESWKGIIPVKLP